MFCKAFASAKVLFGIFNTIFFLTGFIEVFFGFLLISDSQRILLSRLLALPDGTLPEPPFYYLALTLLAVGLTVCAASALGYWATYMPGYFILTLYFLLVLSLLLAECAGGVVVAVWPHCVGLQNARGGAVGALQAYYALPDYEQFTAAMDLAHTQFQCCGMTDARNFDMSVWQLRRLGPRGLSVPLSCCVQEKDSVSYLNPVPLNRTVCQEIRANPQYRYLPGCLEKIENWYDQQYIIFMFSLFVIAVFKLGILLSTVFSCIRLRKSRLNTHTLMMRSHNQINENIYENKMSSIFDEPIKAKYIQPNNFYSPRIRNPRLFDFKTNEVV